jgi:hypothetical protein
VPTLTRVLRADFLGIELDLKGEMLTPDEVTALQDAPWTSASSVRRCTPGISSCGCCGASR